MFNGSAPARHRRQRRRSGVRIYVTHIAGRVDQDLFEKGLSRLRDAGAVVIHDERFLQAEHAYLAHNDDGARLADLQRALTLPHIDAIVCARGGYGSMRTLAAGPSCEPLLFPGVLDRPICGFSDITALHLHLSARRIHSVHGPVVTSLALDPDPDAARRLLAHLRDPLAHAQHALRWLVPPASTAPISGVLVGGNLALMAACAHQHASLLEGAIVLLEDVGEPAYRLDRYLQTLRDATRMTPPAAIVLGDFTRCADAHDVLLEQLSGWNVPVACGLRAGHEHPNIPITLGTVWSLREHHDRMVELTNEPSVRPTRAVPPRSHTEREPLWIGEPAADPSAGPVAIAIHQKLQRRVQQLSDDLIAAPLGSATAVRVLHRGKIIASVDTGSHWRAGARGSDGEGPVAGPASAFDIASLTKPLVTAILCHQAIDAGVVALNTIAPASIVSGRATLADLLRHCSGLPAHERLFDRTRALRSPREPLTPAHESIARALFERVRVDPRRAGRHTYSDLGYIALGRWLELLAGQPLDTLFAANVALPIGCEHLGFRRISTCSREHARPESMSVWTEYCDWRDTPLAGVVHDENAQELDGVAGHAGLFGTADDVARLMRCLLSERPDVLSPESRDRMWSRDWLAPSGSHTLGWDTPSGVLSTAGSGHTGGAVVGHLGFTGTSVWIDLATETAVIALTNRVHGGREVPGINPWRRELHTAVWTHVAESVGDSGPVAAD